MDLKLDFSILPLIIVVFGSAIAILFIEEWGAIYKKLMANKYIKLLAPLSFASFVVVWGELFWSNFLLKLSALVQYTNLYFCVLWSCKNYILYGLRIVELLLLTSIPLLVCWIIFRIKDTNKVWGYGYRVTLYSWIVLVFLFNV